MIAARKADTIADFAIPYFKVISNLRVVGRESGVADAGTKSVLSHVGDFL